MPLPHKHDWASTNTSYRCLNCSAEVGSIAGFDLPPNTYDAGSYDLGSYDTPIGNSPSNVIHGGLPSGVKDLMHLVDYVWYQMGGIGIPLT